MESRICFFSEIDWTILSLEVLKLNNSDLMSASSCLSRRTCCEISFSSLWMNLRRCFIFSLFDSAVEKIFWYFAFCVIFSMSRCLSVSIAFWTSERELRIFTDSPAWTSIDAFASFVWLSSVFLFICSISISSFIFWFFSFNSRIAASRSVTSENILFSSFLICLRSFVRLSIFLCVIDNSSLLSVILWFFEVWSDLIFSINLLSASSSEACNESFECRSSNLFWIEFIFAEYFWCRYAEASTSSVFKSFLSVL